MQRRSFIAFALTVPLALGCGKGPWNRKAKTDGYESVQVGMTEEDVVRVMGKPSKRMLLPLEGSETKQMVLRWLKNNHLIHVSLVNGQVIGKEKN